MNAPSSAAMESPSQPNRWTWVWLTALGLALLGFVLWAGKDWRTARQAVEAMELAGKSDTEKFTLGYAKWGTYWAAMVNGVLCLVLAGSVRWWSAGRAPAVAAGHLPGVGRLGWLMLAIALLVGGALRWHRAGLSFYNDEAHTFKRYVAGTAREDDKGAMKWRQVSWLKTLFFNQVGNNASPTSAIGRISYDAWSRMSKSPPGMVNERALRLPGVIASLAGIVFLWLTARRLSSPVAAGWVALLAASHFWMVRYGNEARGYPLTLLAVAAMAYFLCRAVESERWRWWLAFGVAQFLTLWSFSGAIYYIAVLNGVLLLRALIAVVRRGESRAVLFRPVVGMLVGGMLTLQLMLPTLPQLVAAIQAIPSMKGPMEAVWWRDVASGLTSGLRWDSGTGSLKALMFEAHPWLVVLYVNAILMMGAGLWKLRRSKFPAVLLCLAGVAAIGLGWAAMTARGLFLHHWYVLCALPGLLLLCGQAIPEALANRKGPAWLASLSAALLVGFHLAVNFLLWNQGKEPIRAVTETLPQSPLLLGALYSDVDVYRNAAVGISQKSAEAAIENLEALIARARAEGLPLYIDYTRRPLLASQMPGVLARLENSAEFSAVATLSTFDEPLFHHYLVKWRGVNPAP